MKRNEMISILVKSATVNKPNATREEVRAYVEYLQSKEDQELENMVMINCF
jgi:hypothetical protein